MASEEFKKIDNSFSPENEPPEALRQLEAAAAFQGPWRETHLLMMPQNYQDLAQLAAATQRAIAEGKNEHARFFIEQTVSCANKMQTELEKIKAFSQATIDCRLIGNKKRAEDMQTLSENCLYTLLRDLRADSPGLTDAELIEEKQEIRDAIDLVLIAQTVNQDFTSTEDLLELIDQTQHAADNLFRIFVKLLPHSPEFAQSILKKLRAHCQKKTIPSFVNNVFGTDGELQSELGNNLIQAADKIEKDELVFIMTALLRSGYHIDQLEMLIPHLETLGANTDQLMQDLINAFWTDSGATSIEFFSYLAQKKDISLMMKFFPKYFPTQDYVTAAARAFIDRYKTAEAAISALAVYETDQNYNALSKIVWKIVSAAELEDPTLPTVVQQFSAEQNDSDAGVFRSFGVMLAQYDRGTPEAGWPPIADLLLKSTHADLGSCIPLFFEKYQQDGNCDLLHRAIQLMRDKFPVYKKSISINIFLGNYLRLAHPENEELDDQIIDEVLGLIDTNDCSVSAAKDQTECGILYYLLGHASMVQADPSFETRRRRLLSKLTPLLLNEFGRLDPQQKPKVALQMCSMFFAAGDATTAQRVFEENTEQFEILAQRKPTMALISLYINLEKYEEVKQRGWVDSTDRNFDSDHLITALCAQNLAGEALQIFLQWYPQNENISSRDAAYYEYINRASWLISKLKKAARSDLLVQLFSSLSRSAQIQFASRFLDSGVSVTELLNAAKIEDLNEYGSLLTTLLNYLAKHDEFAAAAALFNSHTEGILSATHASENPRFLLARAKVREAHRELIENTFKLSTIPRSPDDRELVTALSADNPRCTPEHLVELLYQVNYLPIAIRMILTRIYGTESVESPSPLQIPQAHDENRLLQRLAGVFTPSECAFIVQQGWDTALLSKIWQDGYPDLTESQTENLGLMLNLEKKRPGIIKYLNRIFGINCFSRVSEELWLAMYDDRQSDKQWGLVIFSQVDHNGALDQAQNAWEHLYKQIMHTHTLVFCEATSLESIRTALMRAAVHYGKKDGRRKPQEDFKSAFIIVYWHGTESGGTLSYSSDGVVDTNRIRSIAQEPMTIAMRTGRIQSNPVPFLSLGCETGVKFAPTVAQQLLFSEGSGPELATNTAAFTARYAPDGKKLISLIPIFDEGRTLTHLNHSD